MNKLEIYNNGGEPHTLDDLKFLEDGLRDSIIGFGKGFKVGGVEFIILDGLVFTTVGLNYVISDGYVMRAGEVFKVAGATVPTASANIYVNFDEANDPNGTKTFEDLVVINTYKIRQGYVTDLSTGDTKDFNDSLPLGSVLSHMVVNATSPFLQQFINPTAWQLVTAISVPPFESTWVNYGSGTGACRFRKTKTNEVVVSGYASIPSIGGGTNIIFTLPLGYRPAQLHVFTITDNAGVTREVHVATSGAIRVYGTTGVACALPLDSIKFYTD